MAMTIEQFGAEVKKKYPQYQNIPDAELGQKVMQKYPQYQRVLSGSNSPSASPEEGVTRRDRMGVGESIGNFALGAAKGLGSTVAGIGELGAKMFSPIDRLMGNKPIQSGDTEKNLAKLGINNAFTPTNPAQKAGFAVEQVGEFFVPGGAVSKGVKAAEVGIQGARLAKTGAQVARGLGFGRKGAKLGAEIIEGGAKLGTRAAGEAAGAAAVTAAQTGGDFGKVAENATIAGAFPIAGKIVGSVAKPAKKYLSQTVPGKFINKSVLKPLEKEFHFGKDPGKAVVDEGLTANTRKGLIEKITTRKDEIGKQIDALLTAPTAAVKKINIAPAIAKLDEALAQAQKSGEPALYQRIEAIKKSLTEQLGVRGGKLASKVPTPKERLEITKKLKSLKAEQSRMRQGGAVRKGLDEEIASLEEKLSAKYGKRATELSPLEAAELKREIGRATRWTGQAFDNEANQARVAVYRKLNELIDLAVPGTKKLNQRYANMLSAEKSLERTMNIAERQNVIGLPELVGGGIGAATGIASGGVGALVNALVVAGIIKASKSTAVNTRLAQTLSKLSPEEKTMLAKLAPVLRNIIMAANSSESEN